MDFAIFACKSSVTVLLLSVSVSVVAEAEGVEIGDRKVACATPVHLIE